MALHVGQTAYLDGMVLGEGHYLDEYTVLSFSADEVILEHQARLQGGIRFPGDHRILNGDRRLLDYLEQPVQQRQP